MSQRDHELTASATADTSPSVPASPPLRDSMEDADPSLTRKRPRLDSGPIDDSAMHIDDNTSPRHSPAPADQLVAMTIRSQPSSSHAPDSAGDTTPPPSEDIQTAAQTDPPMNVLADGTADSPPVVAIDEDDDGGVRDADAMAGYAAASFHVDFDAEAHLSAFPFMNHGDYLSAAQEIGRYFQGSEWPPSPCASSHANALPDQSLEGHVLNQLALWLDGLPDDPLPWLAFYFNQAALWEEICVVVQRVLNRR